MLARTLCLSFAASLLALPACSSSNPLGTGSGGGNDAGTGSDASSSPDAGFNCSVPSVCAASTPVCCATIPLTGGTVPNCTASPVISGCTPRAQCVTKLDFTCTGTKVVWLCSANSDCTDDVGYSQCCTFGTDGGSLTFCANTTIAFAGGGKCM